MPHVGPVTRPTRDTANAPPAYVQSGRLHFCDRRKTGNKQHDCHGFVQLRFTTASYADTVRAQEVLETYAFPGKLNMGHLFAYKSKRHLVVASIKEDGERTKAGDYATF